MRGSHTDLGNDCGLQRVTSVMPLASNQRSIVSGLYTNTSAVFNFSPSEIFILLLPPEVWGLTGKYSFHKTNTIQDRRTHKETTGYFLVQTKSADVIYGAIHWRHLFVLFRYIRVPCIESCDIFGHDLGLLSTELTDVLPQDLMKHRKAARFGFRLSNRHEIWQAPRQQHHRDAF